MLRPEIGAVGRSDALGIDDVVGSDVGVSLRNGGVGICVTIAVGNPVVLAERTGVAVGTIDPGGDAVNEGFKVELVGTCVIEGTTARVGT